MTQTESMNYIKKGYITPQITVMVKCYTSIKRYEAQKGLWQNQNTSAEELKEYTTPVMEKVCFLYSTGHNNSKKK